MYKSMNSLHLKSVKSDQVFPYPFPYLQRVSNWDFMKGFWKLPEAEGNNKGGSAEVRGKGLKEFTRVQ